MAYGPLQQLQAAGTVLIADTADFEKIARFEASEGTTNPSLLYAAAQNSAYASLISKSASFAKGLPPSVSETERLSTAVDFLAVQFGTQIYKLTGKVSTEVDVTLSFDTKATVSAALRIIDLYKQEGVPKEQVRIKISATWEGIQAARILQSEHGVSCLITVVFGLVQAIAAAEAGVDAIAPYVGRIADWGKLHGAEEDLGVATVSKIQNYLRKHGFKTKVMAASFRNVGQVRDLAGIDLLTAAPAILEAVEKETEPIVAKLTMKSAQESDLPEVSYINDESAFRWAFNADACAVEKSADAMKKFGDDTEKLKALLAGLLA
ncbi:transaldolase [Ilyonectria sp. MPI-CAGE-AT-0026]|nr:transaldolase [Ilyonectria sp. MPI-CAGE-AT-0026]